MILPVYFQQLFGGNLAMSKIHRQIAAEIVAALWGDLP
jgi:hypothetical protein